MTPIRFTEKADPVGANIEIRFTTQDGPPRPGQWNTFAYACCPCCCGNRRGNAYFDRDERWSVAGRFPDFITIAAHEFGHSLGLSHSGNPNTLMYAQPLHNGPHRWLHPNDISRIRGLYGTRPPGRAGKTVASKTAGRVRPE